MNTQVDTWRGPIVPIAFNDHPHVLITYGAFAPDGTSHELPDLDPLLLEELFRRVRAAAAARGRPAVRGGPRQHARLTPAGVLGGRIEALEA